MEIGCSNVSSRRMHTPPSSVIKEVEFDNQPNHSSKGASFIALLGPDFSKQLQIPHEFTKIFIGYVPHRFIIESAMTKKCWRVEVGEEGDGSVYFRQGWTDFVEAHSLQVGDILLFEYDEQSIFQVKIYDKNGCQKMGADARGAKHSPLKIFDFEEQGSEALECEPKKLETRCPCRKKVRRLFTNKYGRGTYKKKHAVPRTYTRTAKVSFAGNKMAFSVKIHKYKRHQFSQLTIPKTISLSKNLASKDEVILQDAMGKHWPVKIRHREDSRAILMHGWKAFLKDNEVAAGDTLNFEVVSDGLIQVGVVKNSHHERKSNEATSQDGEAIAPIMDCEEVLDDHTANVNQAEDSVSTKRGRKRGSSELSSSSFTFLWRSTTTGSYLHIPKVVIEGQNLMNKDSVVLRDPNGKCWPLEVSTRRDGRVALTKGWVEFWKGHDIKAGDSLHFDFVSEYFIQVNIDRGKPLNSPLKTEHGHVVPLSLTDDDEPAT